MRFHLLVFVLLFITLSKFNFSQDLRLWGTYYGAWGFDQQPSIATDASGNVYMTGHTDGTTGIAFGGFQNVHGGGTMDAILIKFDAAGNRIWATYYGGSGYDHGDKVAVDMNGDIYIAGITTSTNAIASGGFQLNHGGGSYDAYIAKFDPAGNRLWATYYGGPANDGGWSITTDAQGYLYLAGETYSLTSIASGGFQNSNSGGCDAFLAKFDLNGNLIWSTYNGGPGYERGFDVAADATGNVFLAGFTTSTSGVASGGFQNTYGGGPEDAFLTKYDASGNRMWSTYYGGTGDDGVSASVATDPSGNVFLAGITTSFSNISFGGFQNSFGGNTDAFLVKFEPAGGRFWATYYGGPGNDAMQSGLRDINITSDPSGNVYLGGNTASITAIASGGFQTSYGGGVSDAFLVKFDGTGSRLCATYYGQTGNDYGGGISIDPLGYVYLAGHTTSTTGIASGGFQNFFGGGLDVYLVKFTSCGLTPIDEIGSFSGYSIYPNPISERAILEFDNVQNKNFTLSIYSGTGQLVLSVKNILTNSVVIERDDLSSGLYFFRLYSEGEVIESGKLLIE